MFLIIFILLQSLSPANAESETKTEHLSKANALCEERLGGLCREKLCPTYCESKYGAWHHSGDMMFNECKGRCKNDMCQIKSRPDSFDTPLDEQMRQQLNVCMKEIPDQKDPEGTDHKWLYFRTEAYGKLEKVIDDKHSAAEKERLEKEKKKKEQEEREYDNFGKSSEQIKNEEEESSKRKEQTQYVSSFSCKESTNSQSLQSPTVPPLPIVIVPVEHLNIKKQRDVVSTQTTVPTAEQKPVS